MSECLIASGGAHSKASIFYGADEYLEACPSPLIILEVSLLRHVHPRGQELQKKYAHDSEIATMKGILPDEGDPNAPAMVRKPSHRGLRSASAAFSLHRAWC